MADILCLDTDQSTIQALQNAGHNVHAAQFGYSTGRRFLNKAPHDFDAIIHDLKQPACYDSFTWGPFTGNDNYRCAIVPTAGLSWESRMTSRASAQAFKKEYRYRLVSETQIQGMAPFESTYGPKDILSAVAKASVPMLVFLNPEWVLRTGFYNFPDLFELRWETSESAAIKVQILDPLAALSRSWTPELALSSPVRCTLKGGPYKYVQIGNATAYPTTPIVADRTGSTLGECVFCENGTIWLVPAMLDNPAVACAFVDSLSAIADVRVKPEASLPVGRPTDEHVPATVDKEWDVFISHASEDKPFTDELANALRKRGIRVWYDVFVLKMGDQLTKKIDEGLTRSRYGIVVLSPSFFAKKWTEAELGALYTRQTTSGKKVILPVWLDISRAEVASYSALLADLKASDAARGVENVVNDVIDAIS